MFCADSAGLFSAKAVSALDVTVAMQPSTAVRISSSGFWKGTIYDQEYMKCRDGSGGGGMRQSGKGMRYAAYSRHNAIFSDN
jgi:hypothetical protein